MPIHEHMVAIIDGAMATMLGSGRGYCHCNNSHNRVACTNHSIIIIILSTPYLRHCIIKLVLVLRNDIQIVPTGACCLLTRRDGGTIVGCVSKFPRFIYFSNSSRPKQYDEYTDQRHTPTNDIPQIGSILVEIPSREE